MLCSLRNKLLEIFHDSHLSSIYSFRAFPIARVQANTADSDQKVHGSVFSLGQADAFGKRGKKGIIQASPLSPASSVTEIHRLPVNKEVPLLQWLTAADLFSGMCCGQQCQS